MGDAAIAWAFGTVLLAVAVGVLTDVLVGVAVPTDVFTWAGLAYWGACGIATAVFAVWYENRPG